MKREWLIASLVAAAVSVPDRAGRGQIIYDVLPAAETEQAHGADSDNADDACIWIHPTDAAQSTVIAQSKDDDQGGIHVYDLAGNQIQFSRSGKMNSVDIRYNFPLGGELVDIVGFTNRSNDSIVFYKVNPSTRRLEGVGSVSTGHSEIYGFCMYHNSVTEKFYAFPNFMDGSVQQWELYDDGSGAVRGTRVREFDVGTMTEGSVVDDESGVLYVGEEDVGVWKYGAEPQDGSARTLVDSTGGHLRADVEGMTIYYAGDGTGYLIVSSQGNNTFVVYEREGDNSYMGTFRIVGNGPIDGCNETDGIDVTNVGLGGAFAGGLFVAHDGENSGGSNSNFKLVGWGSIAGALGLKIDTGWDPRTGGIEADFNRDRKVNGMDLRILSENWLNECPADDRCEGCDLRQDGAVDSLDLSVFALYWRT